VECNAN